MFSWKQKLSNLPVHRICQPVHRRSGHTAVIRKDLHRDTRELFVIARHHRQAIEQVQQRFDLLDQCGRRLDSAQSTSWS